jgi:ATP-dependent DNA ligase
MSVTLTWSFQRECVWRGKCHEAHPIPAEEVAGKEPPETHRTQMAATASVDVQSQKEGAMNPPTYPARPCNGGALESAPPKVGEWSFEPKYAGWRALIHVPTGAMYNRQLQRLSIEPEFYRALHTLCATLSAQAFQWVDAEALARCSNVRGALIVFDVIPGDGLAHATYLDRHKWLKTVLAVHELDELPEPESVLLAPSCPSFICASTIYATLRDLNEKLGRKLYEGVVAKRNDKPYPIQLRGPEVRTPYWMKHRFD